MFGSLWSVFLLRIWLSIHTYCGDEEWKISYHLLRFFDLASSSAIAFGRGWGSVDTWIIWPFFLVQSKAVQKLAKIGIFFHSFLDFFLQFFWWFSITVGSSRWPRWRRRWGWPSQTICHTSNFNWIRQKITNQNLKNKIIYRKPMDAKNWDAMLWLFCAHLTSECAHILHQFLLTK